MSCSLFLSLFLSPWGLYFIWTLCENFTNIAFASISFIRAVLNYWLPVDITISMYVCVSLYVCVASVS